MGLAHAAMIGWPRYFDPLTGRPCPPELVLDRLSAGITAHRPGLRALRPAAVFRERLGPVWPSDHYPVVVDVTFGD